jgi:two-component system cell cycle sensor histidine kinase PleC
LSKSAIPPQADAVASGVAGRDRQRLTWTIAAIILLLAGALGLKAWEERQTADSGMLAALEANSRAAAARLSGHAATADMALRLVAGSGASRTAIASGTPGVDIVVSLDEARSAPADSRIGAAVPVADAMEGSDRRLGLTSEGDIVVRTQGPDGQAFLALAPAGTWLPAMPSGTGIYLAEGRLTAGKFLPGQSSVRPRTGFQSLSLLDRAATGCASVENSGLRVCSSRSTPLFTIDDLVRILIFGLLLAAPILVILGLMNRLASEQDLSLVERAKEVEADRFMSPVMLGVRAGYWEWSDDSSAVYLSDAASELLGMMGDGEMTIAELLPQVHPEHQHRIEEAFRKGYKDGWVQTNFVTSFQPARWMELRGSVTTNPKTGANLYGGVILDITERKQVEDRIKAAERRLRTAIEGFTGPFALWDNRKRLLYWNRAFAADFQLDETLRPGMAHHTVAIARAGALRSEHPSLEDPQTTVLELNSERWIKLVERPTLDGGLISVGVDVTENVRNEEELKKQKAKMHRTARELERSEGRERELSRKYSEEKAKAEHAAHTKSAFLANMSHELRTPLNAINGFSEILSNELYGPLGDERYKGYAQDILTSGQHLLDMINDILDMAKIEAGKMTIDPQPIDPVDPVDAAVRMIRRKAEDKDIEMSLETQPNLPEIDADHRAIRQMVLNLVSNAIKFTDAGGKITVAVEQRGPDIYVGVTDTGIGIPADDLPRLATPFEQVSGTRDRNYEGTGLGLALTKSFAEMHGGRMILSSIEGEGTTVAFTLPITGARELVEESKARDVA